MGFWLACEQRAAARLPRGGGKKVAIKSLLNRLNSRQFRDLRKEGKSVVSPYLLLYYSPGEEFQVGIGTTKRVGKAVQRNLLKRRIREIHRLLKPELRPADLLIISRAPAVELSFAELKEELSRLLNKAGLLLK